MGAGAERSHFGLRPRLRWADRRRRGGAGAGPRRWGWPAVRGPGPSRTRRPVGAVATSRRVAGDSLLPLAAGRERRFRLAARTRREGARPGTMNGPAVPGPEEAASLARPPGAGTRSGSCPGHPASLWAGAGCESCFQCSIWEASGALPRWQIKIGSLGGIMVKGLASASPAWWRSRPGCLNFGVRVPSERGVAEERSRGDPARGSGPQV